MPLPKHLLEEPYRAGDKAGFMALGYWNGDFVGTGPFKIREWARGAYYLLDANEAYPLGRPKLDEVKAIFVSDPALIASNLLAGVGDVNTSNLAMPLETSLDLQNRWPEGDELFRKSIDILEQLPKSFADAEGPSGNEDESGEQVAQRLLCRQPEDDGGERAARDQRAGADTCDPQRDQHRDGQSE